MWGPSEFTHTGTLGDLNLFPKLKNIKVPTMIITGEYDTATPSYMYEVQKQIKDSEVHIVPNAGHGSFYDDNKFYLKAVKQFLNRRFDQGPAAQLNRAPKP
jgi:proline iminopeptidase